MLNLENYYLKSFSIEEFLNFEEKLFIQEKTLRLEFKKGQTIFNEGNYSKGLYIVRKGKIKIYKSNSFGMQTIIYIYKKEDFFGHRSLLAKDPNPVSAEALDNVVLSYIPKEAILSLFNMSEALSKKITLTLSQEFSVWVNKMTVFTQYDVRQRIALSLLILNKVYQKKDEDRVLISTTRNDFASFVGTAKESLVRNLKHFKNEKIITTLGTKIIVLKPEALQSYL